MTDILADLAGMQKLTGIPCVRVRIQRDRPDLLEAFDVAVASHYSTGSVADWFTKHGVQCGEEAVRKHRVGSCRRCLTS